MNSDEKISFVYIIETDIKYIKDCSITNDELSNLEYITDIISKKDYREDGMVYLPSDILHALYLIVLCSFITQSGKHEFTETKNLYNKLFTINC